MNIEEFRKDLTALINRHCLENGSNTPDFILADYLVACFASFEAASTRREKWYGKALTIGGVRDTAYPDHQASPMLMYDAPPWPPCNPDGASGPQIPPGSS